MINFKSIEIDDKDIFQKYYDINKDVSSEYDFATLFAWEEMYATQYAEVNNCLCVRNMDGYMYPIGKKADVKPALIKLKEDAASINRKFKLISITERMLGELKEFNICDNKFDVISRRDLFDYIYLRENLATLSGKKLHGQKNHYNFFVKNNGYEFVDIDGTNENGCIEKLKGLIFERSLNPEKELFATLKVLKYRGQLGFISKCLIVNGEIVGIIMAEKQHGTMLIQIAKSDVKYRGAAVALFKLFCESYFTECEYVNFMEDMGIEGLRKMKLSYSPVKMVEKYLFCSDGE
ncbi:MAG: phosphatidylglycerol lysyltransferase domain-containing protein [Clostridiales bacterium]|jgi:hypothetical protein|nr:phosphatidylglycerol lysyltransferase domain-containing protein [Clostridiales bacterium]